MENITFLGEELSYWIELKKTVQENYKDNDSLIRENGKLRAKVSYYETKLNEMLRYKKIIQDD